MTRYQAQRVAHDTALVTMIESMAQMCEEDADRGIFHGQGKRCTYCKQRRPDGQCRLRVLFAVAT